MIEVEGREFTTRHAKGVEITAAKDCWSGTIKTPAGSFSFDRSYTKSEWANWTSYLTGLGATEAEAKETLLFGRAPKPSEAAACAAAGGEELTPAYILRCLDAHYARPGRG